MGITQAHRTFAQKFEATLKAKGFGTRTVARTIVKNQGVSPGPEFARRVDNQRRQLNKYRSGTVLPTDPSRHAIEDALEVQRDELKAEEEDEGEPPLRLTIPVVVEISEEQIDRALHRAVTDRLNARDEAYAVKS